MQGHFVVIKSSEISLSFIWQKIIGVFFFSLLPCVCVSMPLCLCEV